MFSVGLTCLSTPAFAQLNVPSEPPPAASSELNLTPDDSLGTTVEAINSQADLVTNGVRSRNGANLFHSFKEFNVQEGRSVYFDNPAGVENIFSRVTGSDRSDILGTLGTRGTANLFLLNPNGIIFGPNARLDVRSAFVASTANAIQFGEQGFFSASSPGDPPILTVNPSAFLFNQIPAGGIVNNSSASAGLSPTGSEVFGLRVADGQRLLLVGGNVNLSGGLLAYGGQVAIGGLASSGAVNLNSDGSLGFPEGLARADIVLTNASLIDVAAGDGGEIAIHAGNLNILQGSALRAGIRSGLGTSNSQAGNIVINATGNTRFDNRSAARNQVERNAIGQGGNIRITTDSLSLTNGVSLSAITYGQGDAGDIVIDARNSVSSNRSAATNLVSSSAIGQGGDIRITTNSLSLTNRAALTAGTLGQGNAGDVIIDAHSHVSLEDGGNVSSLVFGGMGQGGDIRITTSSLSLAKSAQLVTSTLGQGDAGNIIINAGDTISFDGSSPNGGGVPSDTGALSSVEENAIGRGGDIRITTGYLSVTNGAQLVANTRGQGDAGDISISVRERVSFDGGDAINSSAAATSVEENAIGQGGDIRITTDSLSFTNGGALFANTNGEGDAGNVTIDARDVFLDGVGRNGESSGLYTSTDREAGGRGRDIIINTDSFRIANGAIVDAETFNTYPGGSITINANNFTATSGGELVTTASSSGQAGDITLNVTDRITLSGRDPAYADRLAQFGRDFIGNQDAASGVFANTASDSTAQGGDISIATEQLIVEDGATVTASSPNGQAGNLTIAADTVLLNQGSLTAQTATSLGEAGANINLQNLELLLLQDGSQISAEASSTADGGNITIDAAEGFVVATPNQNNDILASADLGNGGSINIVAQSVFGIEERQASSGNVTNDIDASSQAGVQGLVTINRLDFDPSTRLTDLPAITVAAEPIQGCQTSGGQSRAEFFNTGRGGLPPTPYQPLSSADILDDVRLPSQRSNLAANSSTAVLPGQIVEAKEWVINKNGEIALIAVVPATVQGHCRLR